MIERAPHAEFVANAGGAGIAGTSGSDKDKE
jgi:hypothetical protein